MLYQIGLTLTLTQYQLLMIRQTYGTLAAITDNSSVRIVGIIKTVSGCSSANQSVSNQQTATGMKLDVNGMPAENVYIQARTDTHTQTNGQLRNIMPSA